jgi:hypothetical protein
MENSLRRWATVEIKKFIIGCIMASMFIGASVTTVAADQSQGFTDVDSSFWGYTAITWGVQQKITSGYEDGTFKPNKTVTEEEFIALLVRAFGEVEVGDKEKRWSDPYYRVAAEKNLPVSDNRTSTISRQSVADIIVGMQGVNFTGNNAVQYMLAKGLTTGKSTPTIKGYMGKDTLTRTEAISFIKNVMEKAESKQLLSRPGTPSPQIELPSLPLSVIEPPAVTGSVEVDLGGVKYNFDVEGDSGQLARTRSPELAEKLKKLGTVINDAVSVNGLSVVCNLDNENLILMDEYGESMIIIDTFLNSEEVPDYEMAYHEDVISVDYKLIFENQLFLEKETSIRFRPYVDEAKMDVIYKIITLLGTQVTETMKSTVIKTIRSEGELTEYIQIGTSKVTMTSSGKLIQIGFHIDK